MYEHPYLMHRVSQIDLERQVVQLERARIAREHPERLVPRRRWVDRMLRRTQPVAVRTTVSVGASAAPQSASPAAPHTAVSVAPDAAACAAASRRVASELA